MSTRFLTILFLSVLGLAAALAIWYSFGAPGWGPPLPDESEYRNTRYDYSFSYPRTLALNEYSTRYVTLSEGEGEKASEILLASVLLGPEGAAPASFDAFIRSQLPSLCAADIPDAALACANAGEGTPFITASGLAGMSYTLDLVGTPAAGGASETRAFGPIYVFDLTANEPSGRQTALLIYAPALRAYEETTDADLLERVARSVALHGVATTSPSTAP
jgi:hypothetical protein